MAAGPNHSIFLGSCATSRIAAYLQCKRPRGVIIPCKNEGILFRESSAEGRREDGAFSPSWEVPWGPPRPPKGVLKIRGGHRSSRQLESLHFYSVPWPPRWGQRSSTKEVVKLTTFFKKAVFKIEVDRRLKSLHFKGWSWMRRQDPSQIPGRHGLAGDWREVRATAGHLVWPPRALGRPLCAVWELSNHNRRDLRRI